MDKILRNLIIPLSITLVVIALYVTLCTVFLKNADEKKKMIPIQVVFFMLVILEVAKIVYLIGRDDKFFPNRYPIVFCSMVMYAFPVFCFKKNRFSDIAMGFCVIPSILAFLMFAALQWKYDMSLMQVHSYIYHGSMLAVALYLMTAKLYRFEFKKYYAHALTVGAYLVFASCISLLIGGAISVFAPTDPYLAFLYNLSGFGVGICILLIAEFVAHFAVYGIIELCRRHKKKPPEGGKPDEEEAVQHV